MPTTDTTGSAPPAEWLNLKDAARYMPIHQDTLRRRINDGQLRAFYVGRSHMVRLRASDLDALMKPIRTVSYRRGAR